MSASETNGGRDFPDRGPAVFAVTTATSALATLFVAARMVSRIGIVRHMSADDYIIILAWLIAFFLSLTIDFGTQRGLGRHDSNIEHVDKPGLRMCEYVFSILYNPALMATKTSILVFYLRLAKNTHKILRLASWGVLCIVNTAGTILTFMNIFQCHPIAAAWDARVRPERCIPLLTEFICSAPVNVTTDLAIMALPIPVITGMHLPPRQKTILVMTFALGIFVTIVDVVRIYYLQQAVAYAPTNPSNDPSAMFGQSAGFSWNASFSLMWSAVEVNVGITCACVPTLKPLIIRILPSMIVDLTDGSRKCSGAQVLNTQTVTDSTKQTSSENSQPGVKEDAILPVPVPAAASRQDVERASDEELSLREFLARRQVVDERSGTRTSSFFGGGTKTAAPVATPARSVYFGFVNVSKPKSMLRATAAESFRYCTVVSVLFFLWGFSYGLLNTLNVVVAEVADMTDAQTLGLTSIYFGGGYFLGPLVVAEWILRHDEHHRSRKRSHGDPESVGGFKATFIVGLLIYGTGTIMFWPGAVLNSYGGFMVSSFVVGFGLAVLETAANPFLALCGPPEYADARLLLAQGVQGVGSVLSGLLANNVFFTKIDTRVVDSTTLLDVQWTYLAVTLLCVMLAFYFYYMPLPEVTDRELDRLAGRLPVDPTKPLFTSRISLKTWCIALAVLAQWTYVSAQENMSIYFSALLTTFAPESAFPFSALNFLLLAHTAFAISRFLAGGLAYLSVRHPTTPLIPTPRTMLTACIALSALFVLIAVVIPPPANPTLIAVPLILFFLFEGPIYPLVFSLALRGQGSRTKRAAAWLTMGGSGPAAWPFVSYAILRAGGSIQTSFIVVVALMVVALVYPVFLTCVRDARTMVDPSPEGPPARTEGDRPGVGERRESEGAEVTMDMIIAARRRDAERRRLAEGGEEGVLKRMSRRWSGFVNTGAGGKEVAVGQAGTGTGTGHSEPWEQVQVDTRILQD
ncbi:major facilitator superfamily domain-containing protein [Cercophora newfieldiana]|uniref:Major facilitator superfamily domain-containing protein n=1 Tax=Cercophora newfieldiana TaxID=92897 RepID=A0AA40CWB6_9PEZI|nr:major facilitator superfamily domain-containing protein [Cercophora newfieldiana]